MLDSKSLQALASVIEEGGFDKAAKRLHLTQSAVSQRVGNLERELGLVLVVRGSPPRPTRAGEELLKHFRKVRLLEQEAVSAVGLRRSEGFTILPLGVNADSLATWFLDAMEDFLREERVLPDLTVDDENLTHELLRRGEVVGCLGARDKAMQGCRCDRLGSMDYLCVSTPEFQREWFPKASGHEGFTLDQVRKAPAVLFNHKDETQGRMLAKLFPDQAVDHPACYVPSSESFVDVVLRGLAYGMVPEPQAGGYLSTGELVELAPEGRVRVELFWHSWDVDAPLLDRLRRALMAAFG